MDVYVARQPIFNKNKKIFGYELLFRESMSNFFSGIDGNAATSKVLSNSFFTIGIEKITGKSLAFINFTRDLLIKNVPLLFSNDHLVVEILEDVNPETDVIDACRNLSQKGYRIALDDFFYRPDMEPMIKISDIIKFDFRQTHPEQLKDMVNILSGNHIKLLAEKVETNEEFEISLEMGFDLFQGYFFSKPEILKGRDISGVQMNYLEIMAEVNKSDFEFTKVEKIIERDVAISYRLLRYLNSAYFKRVNEISSIKQAIVLLGEKGIRSFLSLIAMAKLAENKPHELIRSSIIRAKFCELMGKVKKTGFNTSELFTLGLFSSIDAILDDSMENIMRKLPLAENLKNALINNTGELYEYLRLAISYEKGDWHEVSELETSMSLEKEKLPECFFEAVNWADTITAI